MFPPEQSAISKSSQSDQSASSQALIAGRSSKLDIIFPLYDHIYQVSHISSWILGVVALFFYCQCVYAALWPRHEFWDSHAQDSIVGQVMYYCNYILMFQSRHIQRGGIEQLTVFLVLFLLVLACYLWVGGLLFYWHRNHRLPVWTLYPARFATEVIPPIVLHPVSAFAGKSFVELARNSDGMMWAYFIIMILVFVACAGLFGISFSLSSRSASITLSPYSMFDPTAFVMLSTLSGVMLICQYVFSIFPSWVLIIVQVVHIAGLAYVMWFVDFLPFHLTWASTLAEAIMCCGIAADLIMIVIYFVPSIPGGVPLIGVLCVFVVAFIVFHIVFKFKVKKIVKILTVGSPDWNENDKYQHFDDCRVDRSEKYVIMLLTRGFTERCEMFLDWSLVHYIVDHFESNQAICSVVQMVSFFPGESRKLNILFSRAVRKRDLGLADRFLIYQVYRINTLRQSSTSLQASEKLSDLKNQSLQCEMNIRSFWVSKHPNVSHFERMYKDTSRLKALWMEGIRDYPNNSKFCDEYARFLIECETDFESAILFKHRAEEIESGMNFAKDLAFRSMVRSFPRYLKDGVLDLKGNVIKTTKVHASGSRSSTTHSSSGNMMSSTTSTEFLDPEVEESIGKRIITQSKLRLALHHSVVGRTLTPTSCMKFAMGLGMVVALVAFIGIFVYNEEEFILRVASMDRMSYFSRVNFYIALSNMGLFLQYINETGRFRNTDILTEAKKVDVASGSLNELISMTSSFLKTTVTYSYEGRSNFYSLLKDIADASSQGVPLSDIAAPLMTNSVNMVICQNGDKIRERPGDLKAVIVFILFGQAVMTYQKNYDTWYADDKYCEVLANWVLMLPGAAKLFRSFEVYQVEEGNALERIMMILEIAAPIILLVVTALPSMIFVIWFVRYLNKMAQVMVGLSQPVKEAAMRPIRQITTGNDNDDVHEIKAESSIGVVLCVCLLLMGCVVAALGVGMVYYASNVNVLIEYYNSWLSFAAQRLSASAEALVLGLHGLILNETDMAAFTSRERMLTFSQQYVDEVETQNEGLLHGSGDIPSCQGYDATLDALNLQEVCTVDSSEEGHDTHDTYRCSSANLGISIFRDYMMDLIRHVDSYGGAVADPQTIHLVHLANTHLWYRLRESINRIKDMANDKYDELVTVEAIFMVAGIFAAFLAVLFMNYIRNKMKASTQACIALLKRIPPLEIVNNQEILNFLLDRTISQKEKGSSMTQRVVHRSPDAIIFTGITGIIEIVNAAVTNLFGFTPEQLLGQLPTVLVAPNECDKLMNQLELMKNKQSGPVYEDKVNCVADDGTVIPCAITLLSMTKANSSDVQSFVIILRDESALVKQQKVAEEAKAQSERLLFQILPRDIVVKLNQGEVDICFTVPSASIIFIDIVKFSDYAASLSPQEIMGNLSQVFAAFDGACAKYPLMTKIKLIGDVYMAAAGLFTTDSQPQAHAEQIVRFGLDCLQELDEVNLRMNANLAVRIGVNSGGPILAGVLGTDKPVFDIIGDPINVASRLQSTDIPGHIQIPQSTYDLISGLDFGIEKRGEVFLKGKGQTMAYLVSPTFQLTDTMSSNVILSMSRDSLKELITTTGDVSKILRASQSQAADNE